MRILSVSSLAIPDVKAIRFARFTDDRGYFTEPFRRTDVDAHPDLAFLRSVTFPQINESHSRAGVVRGLHFQWNPHMGKLVRCVHGRLVDLFLDIRIGSPTFGKIAAHDMALPDDMAHGEWIWLPPGFAHGTYFTVDSRIEYLCSAEYNPRCEASVSAITGDLDWSLCDPALKAEFEALVARGAVLSEKDRVAPSLQAWLDDPRANNFIFGEC